MDNIAYVVAAAIIHSKFPKGLFRSDVALIEMPFHRLVDFLGFHIAIPYLDRVVTVVLYGFLLNHDAGPGFYDG